MENKAIPQAFKIVKTDASDIGYGGILKQRVHTQEHDIAYTSKHWNSAQEKYSTVKKEVLAIVLWISKFQSNLLNQNFLIRVDCKLAKDILQKDVKNLASKIFFARWSNLKCLWFRDRIYQGHLKFSTWLPHAWIFTKKYWCLLRCQAPLGEEEDQEVKVKKFF